MSGEGHRWSPRTPRPGTSRTKAPHLTPHTPGKAWPGGGRGGARSSQSSELAANLSSRSAARPGAAAGAGAAAAPPPRPLPRPRRPGRAAPDPASARGGRGRAGGLGARTHVRPCGPRAPPGRPGPPAPPRARAPFPRSGQWPRRLDTPSPQPASRFLCQTKRDGRRGPGGGCGRAPTQGRPGRRRRDAGERPWPGVNGSRCGAGR